MPKRVNMYLQSRCFSTGFLLPICRLQGEITLLSCPYML